MPQSRPNRHCRLNVGVPSIADIERTSGNGSFVPETDIETEPQLQHLIDVEAPAIAHTRTLSNRTNAIEPGVLFRTGFEVRRSAEIVAGGIDCVATVEAIALVGARPVFVDVDPETYTMDCQQLEQVLTPRTRAIIPVHLYGQPVEMQPILAAAEAALLKQEAQNVAVKLQV